jgi:hypothetical protein
MLDAAILNRTNLGLLNIEKLGDSKNHLII